VDYLVNSRTLQFHLIVIGVAQVRKAVHVVAALRGLQSHLAPRVMEGLHSLPRWLFVSLYLVVNMKGWGSMKDERDGNASVSRTIRRYEYPPSKRHMGQRTIREFVSTRSQQRVWATPLQCKFRDLARHLRSISPLCRQWCNPQGNQL
jgi:hypothetical protein